jgi:cell division protein FtsI (penicillin-binding protein 3)
LQLLTFYNAVANGGKMMKPMFVKEIQYHGETIEVKEPEVMDPSICSRSTVEKAHKMLKGVVQRGTAENLKDENYDIAGKTGTVELANREYGYKYQSKITYQASFVGFFPADDPKFSCIVVINSPSRDVYYGNLVAGPVFKEIADKVYAYSPELYKPVKQATDKTIVEAPYTKPGMKNELFDVLGYLGFRADKDHIKSNWVSTSQKKDYVDCKNIYINDARIPSVKGMGAKDATYLLEKLGLKVRINGRGTVMHQSVPAGEEVNKGERVILTMSFTN